MRMNLLVFLTPTSVKILSMEAKEAAVSGRSDNARDLMYKIYLFDHACDFDVRRC